MSNTRYANSVFEQPWWLDIVAPGKWGEVFVKEGGEVVARLPYVIDKKRIIMPPMTQTLGPWISSQYRDYQCGNTQLSKQKEIVYKLFAQLPKHKSLNVCLDSTNDYILPYRWIGYRYEPSFSYRLDDLSDLDELYSKFNKTAKKNIKSANNKVYLKDDPSAEDLIGLLTETFIVQNRSNPYNKQLLKEAIKEAVSRDCGKLFVASDKNGHNHAGAFILYDENVAYYLLAGANPEYRSSGAQSLIIWEAIKFSSRVSKKFDFEGSNIEGIENFFRQFGSERVVNYNIKKLSLGMELYEVVKPRIKRLVGYKI